MVRKNRILAIVAGAIVLCLMQTTVLASASKEDTSQNFIQISPESIKIADIIVTRLEPRTLVMLIAAQGEIIPNANTTTKVTTRVAAQVMQRYAQEGQHIKANESLAVLSSVDMAKAQAELLLAAQEWERVKSLGKDAVSGKRYSEAEVTYQRAYSTALAYGMTINEIDALLRTQKQTQAKGEFSLFAPRAGTVFNINFTEGELIEPGRILLQIVDESTVWVNVKLPSTMVDPIKVGDSVSILVNGSTYKGQIVQVHHQLDEMTRTRSILVELPNSQDALHPGQFVNSQIEAGKTVPVLAIPVDAVMTTPDGDSVIYIEKAPGKFQPMKVTVAKIINHEAIIEGVPVGTQVVSKGAFFIQSEFTKKSFNVDSH